MFLGYRGFKYLDGRSIPYVPLYISLQLLVERCHISSLKLARVEAFILWKLAKATNQALICYFDSLYLRK